MLSFLRLIYPRPSTISSARNQWKLLKVNGKGPMPRDRHSQVTIGRSVIIFGGYGGGGSYLRDVWRYSLDDNSWSEVVTSSPSSTGPMARRAHKAAVMRNKMYIAGGAVESGAVLSDVWELDLGEARAWVWVHGYAKC